jgi:hypothetical protein
MFYFSVRNNQYQWMLTARVRLSEFGAVTDGGKPMANDAIPRAELAMIRLHQRALTLAGPGGDSDKVDIMQALALILEMQRDLALEQSRIATMLSQ